MNRSGFSLIEVMISMLVLTAGVLALTSSTAYVALQLDAADVRTERAVAQQRAVEELRAVDFDSIATVAKADGRVVGDYTVWWDVTSLRWALKQVAIYSEGPAFTDGDRRQVVTDTTTVRIPRPVR